MAPSVAWRGDDCPDRRGAVWGGGILRVLGAGAAPLALRLHARLAPNVSTSCRALVRAPGFRENETALSSCLFPLESSAEYVAAEWERADRPAAANLTWLKLSEKIATAASSFFFLDAELWDNVAEVVRLDDSTFAESLTVATEAALLEVAWPALEELKRFRPNVSDLRAVLEGVRDGSTVEESACRLALGRPPPDEANKIPEYWGIIVACVDAHQKFLLPVEKLIDNRTDPSRLKIEFRYATAACSDRDWLLRAIINYASVGLLRYFVGAIVPAEMAEAAESVAAMYRAPVVAYNVAARARSTGGSARALGAALRRLAAACAWGRLAVLRSQSARDEALASALAAPGLTLRAQVLEAGSADAALDTALDELRAADARVFVVCADAELTARVLARALALNLTRAAGRVWIVCEYEPQSGGGAVAAATLPLRVTFDRRGPGAPPDVVPIADAMLVLAEGTRRLLDDYPDSRDMAGEREDYLTLFWRGKRKENIRIDTNVSLFDGRIERNFTFNETVGVVNLVPLVELWGAGERPLHVLEGLAECPLRESDHVPADGARRCATPVGDPFDPGCLDYLAAVALALAAALRVTWAVVAAAIRRHLRAYERRVADGFCERMLARYPGAFAALQGHAVKRAALEWRRALGSGRFGRVSLAVLSGRPPRAVAVKELLAGADAAEEAEFVREASMLARLHHEHVVRFAGVCVAGGPPLLLMEHAFFGDLRRYLRERRHLLEGSAGEAGAEEAAHVSAAALTRLAREAAEALAYVAACGLIHRDVRAANCLVDARRRLKLADFGMARPVDGSPDGEYACRRRALFPVLWMAPESLARGVASPASDVWALGVLALELVTLGERPWGTRSAGAAAAAVRSGGRPPLPVDAGGGARALTAACWRREPAARPTARALAAWLARRPRALHPALAPLEDSPQEDADSGFGEPRAADFDE